MNNRSSSAIILLCVLMMMLALVGCAASNDSVGNNESVSKPAVSIVIGNTANSKGLNFSSPLVQDIVTDTVKAYGFISVVNVDGQPEIIAANSFDIDERFKNASADRLRADALSKSTAFLSELQTVIADDPEVDYCEGLKLALRSLAGLDTSYTSKTIIVLGSGLSTTGMLDFRNNLLLAEPETIVVSMKEKQAIPDFSGVTVVWQQLGDVADPQPALSPMQFNHLEAIYRGVVESGGGTFICNAIMPNPTNEQAIYPTVSVVVLPPEEPISYSGEDFAAEGYTFEQPVELGEEQIRFVSDSAVFLSYEDAINTLQPIAIYMLETDPDLVMFLGGCIAGDETTSAGLLLSQQRAEAVKEVLIELGVPEERLIAIGLGSRDPWHIYGVGYEGILAAQNRKVVLLDAATELAQSLLRS